MILLATILNEIGAAEVSPGPPPPPPPPFSKKKNVREASINNGEYFIAGSSVMIFNRIKTGIRGGKPSDHLHHGKDTGLEYQMDIAQWVDKYINHAAVEPLQLDDITVGLIKSHPVHGTHIIHLYGEVNHDAPTNIMHPIMQRYSTGMIKIGPPVILTGGSTGIPQYDYEWGYHKVHDDTDGDEQTKYFFMPQINYISSPIGQKVISMMRTTDGADNWTRHVIFTTTLDVSEVCGMHLGGGNYMAFVRLDNGGPHLIFKTTNTWATVTALDPSQKLCYGGSRELVYRTFRNPYTSKWTIRITARDIGWECESVGNDPIADGSFTNSQLFKQMWLWWYKRSGSHTILGYGDEQYPAADYAWKTTMWELDSNTESKVMYSEDDGIDTVSPPVPPLFVDFFTSTSFVIFIDMDVMTEAQRQNFRLVRFSVFSDPGLTAPISARYLPAVGIVSMNNIVVPSHLMNIEAITAGSYYVKVETWNQLGYSSPRVQQVIIT